jgi:putative Holliday junction resolvase
VGRTVALDPGERRIGVSISDTSGMMAFPRPSLDAERDWLSALVMMCEDEVFDRILVGRPLGLAGNETASTASARDFLEVIVEHFPNCEVLWVDERLTTVSASRQLSAAGKTQKSQRGIIDSAAATILLQSWLDANR